MAISLRHNGQNPTDPIIALILTTSFFIWMSMQMTTDQAAACAPLFIGIISDLIGNTLTGGR
jgi:hypothetical protein